MVLRLPDAQSLKDKRRVVKSLLERLGNRFNAAVAETGSLDVWTRAEIAVVTVGNDRRHVNSMLDTLREFVDRNADAEVAEARIEII